MSMQTIERDVEQFDASFAEQIIEALPIREGERLHRNKQQFTRKEVEKNFRVYRRQLASLLNNYPPDDDETAEQYINRQSTSRVLFDRLITAKSHIAEYDNAEAAQRDADRKEAKREADSKRAKVTAEAAPSAEVIARLCGVIERAQEGEQLLSSLWAAVAGHRQAQDARKQLADIYAAEQRACADLGKRAPRRLAVPDAPKGAAEFNSMSIAALARK